MCGWTGKGSSAAIADHRELLAEAGRGHRRAPLGGEHVRGGGCLLALQAAQGPQLAAAERVHAGRPFLSRRT